MTNVEFVDKLPGREVGRREQLVDFADALRKNPGKWGKYPRLHGNSKSAYSAASAINHDKFKQLAGPEFEATARKENDVVTVYVRYTPGKGAKSAPAAPKAAPEAPPTPEATPDALAATEEPSVSYTYPTDQQSVEYTSTP